MPPPADPHGFYSRLGVTLPRRSSEWLPVRCFLPGHQDRHASAAVNARQGTWKCFTCNMSGTAWDAALAVGYTRDDATRLAQEHGLWFGPYPKSQPPARATVQPVSAQVDWRQLAQQVAQPAVTVTGRHDYTYVDEHGAPLLRAVRENLDNGKKRFWQERYDHDAGDWKSGLGDTRRVLYRLPELLEHARAGRTVLLVEGEKVVEHLKVLGVFATTSPEGAGKWRDDYAVPLMGATVIVAPDCDLPGRRHAVAVARSLYQQRVLVRGPLELDLQRQDGFDLADHLAGVADTLRAVEPGIGSHELRARLRDHVERLVAACLPLDPDRLRDYEERAAHFANPTGTLAWCERCQRERPHRVVAGIAYCGCGAASVAAA